MYILAIETNSRSKFFACQDFCRELGLKHATTLRATMVAFRCPADLLAVKHLLPCDLAQIKVTFVAKGDPDQKHLDDFFPPNMIN